MKQDDSCLKLTSWCAVCSKSRFSCSARARTAMIIELIELAGLLLSFDCSVTAELGPPQHPWVECVVGNTNLVISVPHDGRVEPPSIPVRRPGCRNSGGRSQVIPASSSQPQCPQVNVSTRERTARPTCARSYWGQTPTPP